MAEALLPPMDPILIVEDDEGTALLVKKHLADSGWAAEIARTGTAAITWLANHRPSLVLLDNSLPDMTGEELVERQSHTQAFPPFIVTTGAGSERLAVALMKLGARDYLVKDASFLKVLPPAVGRVLKELETERKLAEAEAALQASEARYRHITEGLTDYQYRVFVEQGRAVATTHGAGCETVTGYTAEDFAGDPYLWFTMIAPEDREAAKARVEQILEGQAIAPFEHRLFRKDGALRWVRDTSILNKDAAGGLLSYDGVVQDITAQKLAEEALQDLSQFNEQVVQCAREGIIVYGLDLRYRVWNPYMEAMSGLTASEVIGKSPLELFPTLAEAGFLDRLGKVLSGESVESLDFPFEIPSSGKSGWSSDTSAVLRNASGEIVGIIGTVRDITEHKRVEMELKNQNAFAETLLEKAPIGFAVERMSDGRMVFVNRNFERICGVAPGSLQSSEDFFNEVFLDPAFREEIRQRIMGDMATGDSARMRWEDIPITTQAGEHKVITAINIPLPDQDLMISTVQDITERKHAEDEKANLQAQLLHSQKMDSLGSLAGGVAHDMNNVLAAIMALASVHHMQAEEGTSLCRNMETIIKACHRGGALVKGLLGFARKELAEERELDLNTLVREEAALLERTTFQKVHLRLDLAEDLRPVRGDPTALVHALMNLCVNAVDAMPEGGSLTIRTESEADGMVLLEVADTGAGMPREVLDKAMDPFFTTKPQGKGTGLGLPLVFGIVKAHHGKMEIQSEPGAGTRVALHFPAVKPRLLEIDPAGDSRTGRSQRSLEVLLVDDDELIRHSVNALLEGLGHFVTVVSGGEEALAKLEAGCQPDVVILDLNMPGLDGAGTLSRLRTLRPTLPVLLATGRAGRAALDLVAAYPKVALLPKPFSLDEFQKQLEAMTEAAAFATP